MRIMKNINMNSQQSGYTIIEFMIAGFLGLILLMGVMQVYLGVTQTNRLQTGVIEVQDRGRFILAYIEKDLQRAGWTNFDSPISNVVNYIDFTDASIGTDSTGSASGDGVNADVSGIVSDWIRIEYEADDEDGIDTEYNCTGKNIVRGQTISNQYYVENNQLMCNDNNDSTTAAVVLLEGVETFQVLYGVESIATGVEQDGIVDAYIRADQITGYENKVITVRIAILLSSSNEVLDASVSNINTYQVLDEVFPAANDRKLRRLFVKTILLPNHPIY